jgi:hypothetical protein
LIIEGSLFPPNDAFKDLSSTEDKQKVLGEALINATENG